MFTTSTFLVEWVHALAYKALGLSPDNHKDTFAIFGLFVVFSLMLVRLVMPTWEELL